MERVYGGWDRVNIATTWEKITLLDKDFPGQAGIGNTHIPPNGLDHYDYSNSRSVPSSAEDWKNNYPNLKGETTMVSKDTWGGNDKGFQAWWFDHLPRKDGILEDDKRRKNGGIYSFRSSKNWWKYIFQLNNIPLWAEIDSYFGDQTGAFYDDRTDTYWTTNSTPPVFEQLEDQTVYVGSESVINIRAFDMKGETVSLQMQNLNNLGGVGFIAFPLKNPVSGQQIGKRGELYIMPPTGSAGTYTFRFTASDGRDVRTLDLKVIVQQPNMDLCVMLHGDTNGWYGETRNQRAVITNNGLYASPLTWLDVYLSTDNILDSNDALVKTIYVPSLAPSANTRLDYQVTLPASWSQRIVYVIAKVDPYGEISESDETNNAIYRTIGLTKMPYDVNGDGVVDMSNDILTVISAFKTRQGDLVWNSSTDMNKDGVIDLPNDILTVIQHYSDVDSHVELHLTVSPTSGTSR